MVKSGECRPSHHCEVVHDQLTTPLVQWNETIPSQRGNPGREREATLGAGLAPMECFNSPSIHNRQTALGPSLAAPRWPALDLQTFCRVR